MKTIITSIIILSVFFVTACSKKPVASNPSEVQGTYSGVITGSSGAYEIKVTEKSSTLNLFFDGQIYIMNSYDQLNKGGSIHFSQADISSTMSLDANNIPSITFTIPGHTVKAVIVKKVTIFDTRNFIGTYETTVVSSGVTTQLIYNITLYANTKLIGLEKNKTSGAFNIINGTFTATDSDLTLTVGNVTKKLTKVGNTFIYNATVNGVKEAITLQEIKN